MKEVELICYGGWLQERRAIVGEVSNVASFPCLPLALQSICGQCKWVGTGAQAAAEGTAGWLGKSPSWVAPPSCTHHLTCLAVACDGQGVREYPGYFSKVCALGDFLSHFYVCTGTAFQNAKMNQKSLRGRTRILVWCYPIHNYVRRDDEAFTNLLYFLLFLGTHLYNKDKYYFKSKWDIYSIILCTAPPIWFMYY